MAIRRSIRTRAVEAIIALLRADADISGKTGAGTRIYHLPYSELPQVGMHPAPRQIHVYSSTFRKAPSTGGLWDCEFDLIIEYYSPINEGAATVGGTTVADEVEHVMALLYAGDAPSSPGRFEDPDNAGLYINTETVDVGIVGLDVAANNAAIRRNILVTLKTKESPDGYRSYELD